MSSNKTPHLNLHHWTGSDQVLRTEFNENFEKLDTRVSQLMAADATPVQLNHGMQNVDVKQTSVLENISIKGRTLVNLLGHAGNCEDAAKWNDYHTTHALNPNNFVYGSNGLKVTVADGYTIGSAVTARGFNFDADKYYLLMGELKNGNATQMNLSISGQGPPTATNAVVDTSKFTLTFGKFTGISATDVGINVTVTGAAGQFGYADGVRLFEISKEDYDAIDRMTPEQIAVKWPYVEDRKSIYSPYIIKYGENLLPPFTEWEVIRTDGGTNILGPYKIQQQTTAKDTWLGTAKLPCMPSTPYTLSMIHTGKMLLRFYKKDGTFVEAGGGYTSEQSVTGTSPSDVSYIVVYTTNPEPVGTFTFEKGMLNVGPTALPFKPRHDDMLLFPNVQLASSADGKVYDQLFKSGGKYWKHTRIKTMVLDGSRNWKRTGNYAGFKQLSLESPVFPITGDLGLFMKYDKVLPNLTGIPSAPDRGAIAQDSGIVYVTVSDEDSGWGDKYEPSKEEIKAYFYGWKLIDTSGKLWNGGDPQYKRWYAYWSPGAVWNPDKENEFTKKTAPSNLAPGYKPYSLQYQLAVPTVEEIRVEGGITLHSGLNQVEVGTGIIIRERANPIDPNGIYLINNTAAPGSSLKNRTNRILTVFRNDRIDQAWIKRDSFKSSSAYGGADAFIPALSGNYDPTAVYTVTYLARDQYALTCNVQSIQGEYAGNLKSVVDTLAANQADMASQVSVVQGIQDRLEAALPLNALSRQAIINGGFDIAQRGTSVIQNGNYGAENAYGYGLDRWVGQVFAGFGGLGSASFTMSQQPFALGQTAVPGNPKYFGRLSVTSVGTKGTRSAFMRMAQFVESVYTFAGQKCTVSFWAKASSSRQIAVSLFQNFGYGGSPSSSVSCPGGKTINLTTAWQFFTVTFDVPSIAGKTLGTSKSDYLGLYFIPYKQDNEVISIPSGEVGTYATGDFDFAQVQLCAGDVALPFQPRHFAEELALCQRYFCKTFPYSTPPANNAGRGGALGVRLAGSTEPIVRWQYPVPMRISPSFVLYSPQGGTTGQWRNDYNSTSSANAMPFSGSEKSAGIGNSEFSLPAGYYEIHAVADAEI
ncbi:hypothetical protein [Paenibacillus oleatilyticus]|uniref:hypothetical protein n=1 Tax=Paenibacillus oleatilyticus TaxID=2594886 RepID=UPI001C1F9FCC|nr:hypothetical protein [Paenibacillus oleatilyticus]MBU7316236.1 hypothetical protein [Paenibacillus oleatilyticus]